MPTYIADTLPHDRRETAIMDVDEHRKRVVEAWRAAATALSIKVEAPYLLKTGDGGEILCAAHLPDFGGRGGMVFDVLEEFPYENRKEVASAAKSRGLYYSIINPEVYGHHDEEVFIEALADWSFFGADDQRPHWLPKPPKSE